MDPFLYLHYWQHWHCPDPLIHREKLVEPKLPGVPHANAAEIAEGLRHPVDSREFRLAMIRLESQLYLLDDIALAIEPGIRAVFKQAFALTPEHSSIEARLRKAFDAPVISMLSETIAKAREALAEGLRISKGEEIVVLEKLEGYVYFDADPAEVDIGCWPKFLGVAHLVASVGWSTVKQYLQTDGLPREVAADLEDLSVVKLSWARGG